MGLYSNVIFPRFYDRIMDKPFWAAHRREQLAHVDGEILEIGVGTGLNLPHYPDHVKRITTVDPNPGMNRVLQRRIEATGVEVDKRVISSESLPFEDGSFDCVVSTITMCSIPDVHQALAELFRVLRPGGRLEFLEHGISPDEKVRRWQHRLDGVQRRFADGCSLVLDVPSVIASQPFDAVALKTFYMEKTPRTHGYTYRGTAIKPA